MSTTAKSSNNSKPIQASNNKAQIYAQMARAYADEAKSYADKVNAEIDKVTTAKNEAIAEVERIGNITTSSLQSTTQSLKEILNNEINNARNELDEKLTELLNVVNAELEELIGENNG